MEQNMNMKLAALGAFAVMSAASMAYGYYSSLPGVQREGSITYITGGDGDEARTAMEAVRGQYNLRIANLGQKGAFSGDSALAIYDRMGNEVVNADAGPIFYARLPAGKYYLSSNYEGTIQKKEVKVAATPVTVHFTW